MRPHRASELDCEATLIDAAVRGGWMVHGERTVQTSKGSHMTAIKGQKGFPDLVLAHPSGALLFIELKRPPNKVEPAQQKWHDVLRSCGAEVEVWLVPDDLHRYVDYLLNYRANVARPAAHIRSDPPE